MLPCFGPNAHRAPAATIAGWLSILALVVLVVACGGGSASNQPANGDESAGADATSKSWAGKDPAPDFPGGLTWFNVDQPLSLAQLRGKVVLLDFWTLGCINCQHIIPDLKKLESEFGDALAVVGVHSGKYATEHDDDSIREAIERYGLEHAVVNDPDFAIWQSYGVNAWPTTVLIDPAGNLVGGHSGEGVYDLMQPIVASLIGEFGDRVDRTPVPLHLQAKVADTVLSFPGKVLADEAGGRLFIADSGHNRILVAGLDGALRQAIGDGKEGFADGAPDEAEFRQPQGIGLSPDGKTLYVADTRNHAIRAVDLASGTVTTIAGTGKQLDSLPVQDARATETALASPWDVVAVGQTLYISMAGVHQLWALDLRDGTISVFAGTSREGIDDGERKSVATLAQPSGIASDGTNLYWVDPESSSVRTLPIAGDGPVRTIVGTGLFDYGDTDGTGKSAKIQHAQGLTLGGGVLYISDTYNHKVKRVDPASGAVTTLAGSERGLADGAGPAAALDEPGGLGYADGKLYVADTNNNAVRVVDASSGAVTTLAPSNLGVASGGLGGQATRVELAPVQAAPGTSTLRVRLSAPEGYHLNSQAPSKLTFTVDNAAAITVSEPSISWSTDDASVDVPVPVTLQTGRATLTAAGQAYYCREGEEALCFIEQVELVLPIEVTAGSTAGEVVLAYTLPPAG